MPKQGDTVRILQGPFRDFIGMVTAVDREREVVRITINVFGRETPAEVHFDETEVMK